MIYSWMISNKLSVNLNKTEYLLFSSLSIIPPVSVINLDSNAISPTNSA